MNDLLETFSIVDGYDRNKTPRSLTVRRVTLEEIRQGLTRHEYVIADREGKARRIRKSSQVKTWKRDPERFECSFKYGLYESMRFTTQEMLDRLLIEV